MRIMLRFLALLALMLGCVLPTAQAQAQSRTWVSGVGDDTHACSRTAPCKTFAGAYGKTPAGGEIDCLDAGDFGPVTIAHSITINCSNVTTAITSGSGSGVTVNAGAGDVVVLRGLDINGFGVGLNGILLTGGTLHVENCRMRGFLGGGGGGIGLRIQPSPATTLSVEDSTITDNTSGIALYWPSATPVGASGPISFRRVRISNNIDTGVSASGNNPNNGLATISITDSNISVNGSPGVLVLSGVTVDITRTILASNDEGVESASFFPASSTVTLRESTLANNFDGAVRFFNDGALLTFGDNNIVGPNGTGFSGPISLQ